MNDPHAHSVEPVEVRLPGSKSVTHRAFILAAQCAGGADVRRPLLSADTRSTLAVLAKLGASWRMVDDADVRFEQAELRACDDVLPCGNSGTTLRLASGLCATLDGDSVLDGDDSLRKRPNGPLLDGLRSLGAGVSSAAGRAPLHVGGRIRAAAVAMPSATSSQYLSSLALAAARTDGETTIHGAAPVLSRPYLDITARTAAAFGVQISLQDSADGVRITVVGPQRPSCASGFEVPADWSSAAFPLVAGAVLSVGVAMPGLDPRSAQGDAAVVGVMQRFGLPVRWLAGEPHVLSQGVGRPVSPGLVDVAQTPDMFPALCALAACSEGTTTLDGAPGLRDKECDRIAAMVAGLKTLGVRCEELRGGAVITGGPLGGGAVQTFEDHRVYMAFAILAAVANERVDVDHPDCVAISYPSFHADLQRIQARSQRK